MAQALELGGNMLVNELMSPSHFSLLPSFSLLVLFSQCCLTEHWPGERNHGRVFLGSLWVRSPSSGAASVSPEGSLLGSQVTVFSLCPHGSFPLCSQPWCLFVYPDFLL